MVSTALICTIFVFLGSFALTFGLTFLPCYSAICVEEFFPNNVRIHIGAFYGLILAGLSIHTAYKKVPIIRHCLQSRVSSRPVPFTSKYATWGSLITVSSVVAFVAACQGYFWADEKEFYAHRALTEANTTLGTTRLAIVGTTGHMCDFLLGLVIIPISRDSILRTTFEMDTAHLLWFHKFVGYFLFLVVCIHTIAFYTWVPVFVKADMPLKDVFGIDNPTKPQHEVDENVYYATVLATGMVSFIIFIAIIITSIPKKIRQHYNTFYYTHMLSITFFILSALHASTDFYLLLPGLLLWLIDWFNRLRGLSHAMDAQLQREENGWYRIVVPRPQLPAHMIQQLKSESDWPLKHFYLCVPAISKWQSHPYTTTSDTQSQDIVWLFRVSNLGKKEKIQQKEWTVKLADMVSDGNHATDVEVGSAMEPMSTVMTPRQTSSLPGRIIKLRTSPSYSIPYNPFVLNNKILCIVGGTGITGALSLANTYNRLMPGERPGKRCITQSIHIIWSIRESDDADLVDVQTVLAVARSKNVNLTMEKFITGASRGRLDFNKTLMEQAGSSKSGRTWIYLSGPNAFMEAGENACFVHKQKGWDIEWHCAKWDV